MQRVVSHFVIRISLDVENLTNSSSLEEDLEIPVNVCSYIFIFICLYVWLKNNIFMQVI